MMNKGLDNGQDLPQELLMVWDSYQVVIIISECTIRVIMIALKETHYPDLRMGAIWLRHFLVLIIRDGWSKRVANTRTGKDVGSYSLTIVYTISKHHM